MRTWPIDRRRFLRNLLLLGLSPLARGTAMAETDPPHSDGRQAQGHATIYRATGDDPAHNLTRVLESMGGVEALIGVDDVVVIKPNAQWWNQGAPNLAALNALVQSIMDRPGGFQGEVVLAENCHRGREPWNAPSSGWCHPFARNSDLADIRHLNDLVARLKTRFGSAFSCCHWLDADKGGRRVSADSAQDGYVFCDGTGGSPLLACDNGLEGTDYRSTIMTYPIFTTERGTVVDLRHGIRPAGTAETRRLRLINLAGLNHHSWYCGVTSALKNHLGISDLSGGADPDSGGKLTEQHYNFHSFPFNEWKPGPRAGMLGRAVGTFVRTIRQADLHIVTAHWIGLASRTEKPVVRTKTVLAGTDPVALDYHGAKHLLFANSRCSVHDPDHPASPIRADLMEAARIGAGTMNPQEMEVVMDGTRYPATTERHRFDVPAPVEWGSSLKIIPKYLYLRYF